MNILFNFWKYLKQKENNETKNDENRQKDKTNLY